MKFSLTMKSSLFVKFLYSSLLLIFSSVAANATNFYVSNTGNNSNNGTSPSSPWLSLSKVQTAGNDGTIKAGDNILFKKGDSFTGPLYWSTIYGNTAASGTASSPITFGTYGIGAKPIFQMVPNGGQVLSMLSFVGVQYIIVDGFNITDLSFPLGDKVNPANCGNGIELGSYGQITSNHCTIKNISASNIGAPIVIVGDFNTVDSCSITDLKNIKNTLGTAGQPNTFDDDYGANGITITGNDNTVTHSYFSGNWAASYDYGYNGGAFEMFDACSRNKFLYNTMVDCGGIAEFGAIAVNTVSTDNLYAYNKIINCGLLNWCNLTGSYTTNVNNTQYFNNVIIENNLSRFSGPNNGAGVTTNPPASLEAFSYNGSPSTTVYNLKNNIFQLSSGINVLSTYAVSKTTHANNIYKLSNGSIANYTLGSTEANTVSPIFLNIVPADASLWDFNLATGSPAINFGQTVGITSDFAGIPIGAVPNAGIFEKNPGGVSTLTASSTSGSISCNGSTTAVLVSASGGTAPYTGTGSFTVSAGIYNYTVTDAAGIKAATSVTVTQPTVLNASVAAGTITVYGSSTNITVTGNGGTAAYSYNLDAGTYQSSNIFTVFAGTYTIMVKDANGCTVSKTITITQPAVVLKAFISLTIQKTDVNCKGGNDGTIIATPNNGVAPYLYSINDGAYATTNTFLNLNAGIYKISVKDSPGNVTSSNVTILDGNRNCKTFNLKVFPNPTTSQFALTIETNDTKTGIQIIVMNMIGQTVYQASGKAGVKNIFGINFVSGSYLVKVIQGTNTGTLQLIKVN